MGIPRIQYATIRAINVRHCSRSRQIADRARSRAPNSWRERSCSFSSSSSLARRERESKKKKRGRERDPESVNASRIAVSGSGSRGTKGRFFRYRRYAGDLLAGISWRAPIRRSSGGEALRTARRITSQYIVVGQLRGSVTFSR